MEWSEGEEGWRIKFTYTTTDHAMVKDQQQYCIPRAQKLNDDELKVLPAYQCLCISVEVVKGPALTTNKSLNRRYLQYKRINTYTI